MIPISKNIIEPKIKTLFVDSLEEFEGIITEFEPNTLGIAFDNFKQCLYIGEKDKYNECLPIKIYIYEDIKSRVQDIPRNEFIEKCKKAGFDDTKIKIAVKLFIENEKPLKVWEWIISNNLKDIEWDSVYTIKYRIKKEILPELIKHRQKLDKKNKTE